MPKQLNVDLRFTADTTAAKKNLADLQTSLTKISSFAIADSKINAPIQEAAKSAKTLQSALSAAMNVKTGNIDLNKFQQSLTQSGTSATKLATNLLKAGETGETAFLQLQRSVSSANIQINKSVGLLGNMLVTLKNAAKWQISSSLLHGLMSSVSTAYNYAQDLNESLTSIRIVTGESADQMAEFAERANKAAQALSTTTTAYTDAALIFYQQGLSDAAVEERTNATIKMAQATGDSATEVSSYMTAIWNNFDDGSESLEHYADVITALGASTASSSSEIAEGLSKFASVAQTAGLSYEYATSALATVVATTRQSADTVGTAFKTLFARIQDLEQGTTDDGTTLGQYSKALQKIGVDIKDASGELKSMDTILDELGAKWSTLSDDTKIATAQAVAGTRQYTQLMALMNNWDAFQTNLSTANDSEGTLTEQAEIYEESWAAASKRVKAALQAIYADLFDDKFFIKMADAFTGILQVVDKVIDGMGGVKTIVLAVATVITNKFSAELTASLNSGIQKLQLFTSKVKDNFSNLGPKLKLFATAGTGSFNADVAANAAVKLKLHLDESADAGRQLSSSLQSVGNQAEYTSDGFKQQEKDLKQIDSLTETYHRNSQLLTEEQQHQVESQLQQLQNLSQIKGEQQNILSALKSQQEAQSSSAALLTTQLIPESGVATVKNVDALMQSLRINVQGMSGELKGINVITQLLGTEIKVINQETGAICTGTEDEKTEVIDLETTIRKIVDNTTDFSAGLAVLKTRFEGINDETVDLRETIQNSVNDSKEFGEAFKTLINNMPDGIKSWKQINQYIEQAMNNNTRLAQAIGVDNQHLALAVGLGKKQAAAIMSANDAAKQYENTLSSVSNILQNGFKSVTSLGGNLTSIFSTLSSVAMAVSTISNAIKTLQDDTASGTDRFVAFAMAGTMGMSAFMSIIGQVDKGLTALSGIMETNLALKVAEISTDGILTTQKSKDTVQVLANAAALAIQNDAMTEKNKNTLISIAMDKLNLSQEQAEILVRNLLISLKGEGAIVTGEENVVKASEGAVNKAVTKTNYDLAISEGAVGAAIGATIAPILAITAAILAVVGIIWLLIKAYKSMEAASPEQQLEDLKTASEDLATATENAKNKVEDLKSAYEDYQSVTDTLKSCTKGTNEWTAAMLEANKQAMDLINTYGQNLNFGTDYSYDSDGILKISSSGYQSMLQAQNQQYANALVLQYANTREQMKINQELNKDEIVQAIIDGLDDTDLSTWIDKNKSENSEAYENAKAEDKLVQYQNSPAAYNDITAYNASQVGKIISELFANDFDWTKASEAYADSITPNNEAKLTTSQLKDSLEEAAEKYYDAVSSGTAVNLTDASDLAATLDIDEYTAELIASNAGVGEQFSEAENALLDYAAQMEENRQALIANTEALVQANNSYTEGYNEKNLDAYTAYAAAYGNTQYGDISSASDIDEETRASIIQDYYSSLDGYVIGEDGLTVYKTDDDGNIDTSQKVDTSVETLYNAILPVLKDKNASTLSEDEIASVNQAIQDNMAYIKSFYSDNPNQHTQAWYYDQAVKATTMAYNQGSDTGLAYTEESETKTPSEEDTGSTSGNGSNGVGNSHGKADKVSTPGEDIDPNSPGFSRDSTNDSFWQGVGQSLMDGMVTAAYAQAGLSSPLLDSTGVTVTTTEVEPTQYMSSGAGGTEVQEYVSEGSGLTADYDTSVSSEWAYQANADGSAAIDLGNSLSDASDEVDEAAQTMAKNLENLPAAQAGRTDAADVYSKLQSGDLDSTTIASDDSYKDLISQIETLETADVNLGESAEILKNTWLAGTNEYYEALSDIEDQLYNIEQAGLAAQQATDLEDLMSEDSGWFSKDGEDYTIDISADPEEFQETMDSLIDQEYAINVEIHSEAEQEFEDLSAAIDNVNTQASKIGENFIVSADDVRELGNAFPGILENCTYMADGTIKLNKEIAQSAMETAETQIQADAQATVASLEEDKVKLQAKKSIYESMADAAATLAQSDVANDEAAKEAQNTLAQGLAELQTNYADEASRNATDDNQVVADNASDNARATSESWKSAWKSMATDSYTAASAAIQNMNAVKAGGGTLTSGSFGNSYRGSAGVAGTNALHDITEQALSNVTGTSSEVWAEISNKYAALADATGEQINDIDSMIVAATSQALTTDTTLGNVAAGKGARTSRSRSSSSRDRRTNDQDTKDEEDEIERYHVIKNQLEDVSNALDKISKAKEKAFGPAKLALMDKEIKKQDELISKQEEYLAEIQDYLESDKAVMSAYGAVFDENGTITNYEEIAKAQLAKYNAAVAVYNTATTDDDAAKATFKAAEEEYEAFKDALDKYEESQDLYAEEAATLLDDLYEKYDMLLEETQEGINLRIDYDDSVLEYLDYLLETCKDEAWDAAEAIADMGKEASVSLDKSKTYMNEIAGIIDAHNTGMGGSGLGFTGSEFVNNLVNGTLTDAMKSATGVSLDENNLASYTMANIGLTEDEIDAIKEAVSNLLEENQNLEEYRADVFERLESAFDGMNEDLDNASERIQHIQKMTESYSNIVDIVGKKALKINSELIKQMGEASIDNAQNLVSTSKNKMDAIATEISNAEIARQKAIDQGLTEDVEYWDSFLEHANEEFESAQEDFQQNWEDALQAAADAFSDTVDVILEDFGDAVGGIKSASIEALRESFDLAKEIDDDYVDEYEKMYQLTKLNREIAESIDDTNNVRAKQELLELQDKINQKLSDGEEMSEHDLEMLQKEYDLKLAEIALEEAQNTKSQVSMTRDSEGNYGYVYTADANAVADAEQSYEDKLHDMEQANADYIDDLQEKIIALQESATSKMKDAADTYGTDSAEYARAMQEIQGWYNTQLEFYASELNQAMVDSDTAFNDLILSDITGYQTLADLVDNCEKSMADSMYTLSEAEIDYMEQNEETMERAGTTMEDFAGDYTEEIESSTEATDEFRNSSDEMTEDVLNNFDEILDSIKEFESMYSSTIDNMISRNTRLVNSFNQILAAWSGIEDASDELDRQEANENSSDSNTDGSSSGSGEDSSSTSGDGSVTWEKVLAAYKRINGGYWGEGLKNRIAAGLKEGFTEAEVRKAQEFVNYYYPKSQKGKGYSWENAKKAIGFDTGGYTGSWSGTDGKWALLHQKEIVLNEEDTKNLLSAVDIIRTISQAIDLNASAASNGLASILQTSGTIASQNNGILEQQVTITAEFPSVTDKNQILEAFDNVINLASQYANRKN